MAGGSALSQKSRTRTKCVSRATLVVPGMGGAKQKARECWRARPGSQEKAGDGLLSHHLSVAVPSALQGLTAVFGMGTGVAPAR